MDYRQQYFLRMKLANPTFKRQFMTQQRAQAEKLVKENLVSWDGERWNIYPVVYHVEEKNGSYICDCSVFDTLGFCAHICAIKLKEGR